MDGQTIKTNNKSDLITVVVPCYNAEKNIENCIMSLKGQTYSNLQVIFVDDKSQDNTYSIICEKIKGDDRFFVYKSNPPHGVASARNVGIEKCEGEYITFFDCDDILSPFHIENLYLAIKGNKADIAICAHKSTRGKCYYKDIKFNKQTAKISTFDKHTAMEKFLSHSEFDFCVWNKLYSVGLIKDNGIRFIDGCRYNEDTHFNYSAFKAAEKVVYSSFKTYHYVKSSGSLVRRKFGEYKLDAYKSLNKIINDASINYPEMTHYAHAIRITMTCEILWRLFNSKYKNPLVINKIIEITAIDAKHLKCCKKVAFYRRLLMPLVPFAARVLLKKRRKMDNNDYVLPNQFLEE